MVEDVIKDEIIHDGSKKVDVKDDKSLDLDQFFKQWVELYSGQMQNFVKGDSVSDAFRTDLLWSLFVEIQILRYEVRLLRDGKSQV